MRTIAGWIYTALLVALLCFSVVRCIVIQRELSGAEQELYTLDEITDRLASENEELTSIIFKQGAEE